MGGVGAWRERENEKANFGKQWDEPPPTNDDEDTDDDDEETSEEEEEEGDERVDKGDRPIKLSKKEMRQLQREARVAREEVWGYDDDTAKVKKAKEEEALMRDDDVSYCVVQDWHDRTNSRVGIHDGHDAQNHEHRPRTDRLRQKKTAVDWMKETIMNPSGH